jgi:hypothetical protein
VTVVSPSGTLIDVVAATRYFLMTGLTDTCVVSRKIQAFLPSASAWVLCTFVNVVTSKAITSVAIVTFASETLRRTVHDGEVGAGRIQCTAGSLESTFVDINAINGGSFSEVEVGAHRTQIILNDPPSCSDCTVAIDPPTIFLLNHNAVFSGCSREVLILDRDINIAIFPLGR